MKRLFLFVVLCLSVQTGVGQSDPNGVQPFSTQIGPVDAATLNIHMNIPVVKKAGIGLAFAFDIVHNNNFWKLSGSQWLPYGNASSYGWDYPIFGYFEWTVTTKCADGIHYNRVYSVYHDGQGNAHPLNPPGGYFVTCGSPANVTLKDGSGIVVTLASETQGTSVATFPDGTVATPNTSFADANGNTISSSGPAGNLIDTLGVTELTFGGGAGIPPFIYPGPNGTSPQVVQNNTSLSILTNFGCSGKSEYPGTHNLPTSIVLPDGSQYSFTYEPTPGHAGNVTGRLASITLPTGGVIQYAYTGSNNGINCADGSTAGLTVTTPDGATTYVRNASFNQTTVTKPNGDYVIYNFAGGGPYYEVQRRFYASGGTLKLTVTTCYDGNQTNCGSVTAAPALPINQIDKYTLIAGKSISSRTTTLFDAYNNVTDVKAYDFGASTPTSETAITYGSYSGGSCSAIGSGIVNKPCKVQQKNGSGTVLAETHITYNSTGHPTATAVLKSGSTYLTTNATFNVNGTTANVTEPNGAVTTFHYDGTGGCNNGFVSSVSHPLSLTDSTTYDCNGGVPLTQTDVNGKVTTISYVSFGSDPFWRPIGITDPASAVTNFIYSHNPGFSSSELDFNGNLSAVQSQTYLDSLGRAAQNQSRTTIGGTSFNTVSYQYDSSGQPSGVSDPCITTANTNCGGPFTTTTYDALNRPLVTTDPNGGTLTNTYTQNDVLSVLGPAPTGENSKQKQYEYDGLGRLASVCEITSLSGSGACGQAVTKTGYLTKYTYDALGRVTQASLNAQGTAQNRSFTYDSLSRLLTEANPESGTTTYTYDSASGCTGTYNGDLVKRVDARGISTCYTYDSLHRPLTVSYSDGTPTKTFVYDSATVNGFAMSNAKGHLAEAYTGPSGSKITDLGFSYTVRGELTDTYESTPHSSGYYHVASTFWESGAPKTLFGLSLPTLNYNADPMGRPTTVSTSGADPVTATTYDVASRVTDMTLGSGDTVHFGWDNDTGQMTQYKETINGSATSGTLTWNANGTLQKNVIVDPFNSANGQTCTYGYDDLARVNSVACGTPWSQTFTYDAFGNLTKSGSLNWQPGYSAANNRYTLGGTSYDAAGNLLNDTFHTYTWDAEGKPKTIDAITLIFDALGREVEVQNGGTNTEFVPRLAVMNGQTQTKAFVPLPGGARVRYNGGTLASYYVPDWLGSMRLGSTQARAFNFSLAFAPFGEQYANSTNATGAENFASNRSDTVNDEYNADDRKLHPSQGRWISPDPAGLSTVSLGNPQTWNRYAYVSNQPLTSVDPHGTESQGVLPNTGFFGIRDMLSPFNYLLGGDGMSST
jgi:RHS repeat-associated protein